MSEMLQEQIKPSLDLPPMEDRPELSQDAPYLLENNPRLQQAHKLLDQHIAGLRQAPVNPFQRKANFLDSRLKAGLAAEGAIAGSLFIGGSALVGTLVGGGYIGFKMLKEFAEGSTPIIRTPLNAQIQVIDVARTEVGAKPREIVLVACLGVTDDDSEDRRQQLIELREVVKGSDYEKIAVPTEHLPGEQPINLSMLQRRLSGFFLRYQNDPLQSAAAQRELGLWTRRGFELQTKNLEYMSNSEANALDKVMRALLVRVPSPRLAVLFEQPAIGKSAPPELKRYIDRLLQRGAEEKLGSAEHVLYRGLEEDPAEGPPFGYRKNEHLTTEIRQLKGEYIVRQFNGSRQLVRRQSLESIAAIKEDVQDPQFWEKLAVGAYSTLEMAFLARRLVDRPQMLPDESTRMPLLLDGKFNPLPLPEYTEPADQDFKKESSRFTRRLLTRAAMVGLVVFSVVNAARALPENIQFSTPPPAPAPPPPTPKPTEHSAPGTAENQGEDSWQVEPHGLDPVGYYASEYLNDFDPVKGWSFSDEAGYFQVRPPEAPSSKEPHLTLSQIVSPEALQEPGIPIPIKQGTQVGAIRIQGFYDGMVQLEPHLNKNAWQTFYLAAPTPLEGPQLVEIDLVPTSSAPNRYFYPMTDEQRYDMQELTKKVRESYRYDNTPHLDRVVKGTKQQPLAYDVARIEKAGICNCNVCATQLTLQAWGPELPVVYTRGFMNTGKGPASNDTPRMLEPDEKHAWVTSFDKKYIFDSTPAEITPAQARADRAKAKAQKKAEEAYKAEQARIEDKKHITPDDFTWFYPPLAIAGLGTFFAVRAWRREKWWHKPEAQAAYDLLNWYNYGQVGQQPQVGTWHHLELTDKGLVPKKRGYLHSRPLQTAQDQGLEDRVGQIFEATDAKRFLNSGYLPASASEHEERAARTLAKRVLFASED